MMTFMNGFSFQKGIWLFLSVICGVFLFVGGPGQESLRTLRATWNIGHVVCFALWGLGYLRWRGVSWWRSTVEILLLALCVGAATELIQSRIGRDASFDDLWHDVIGGLLGLLLYLGWRQETGPRGQRFSRILAIGLILWFLAPVAKVGLDDLIAWQQFPLLSGFETPLEASRWSGSAFRKLNDQHVFEGASSLQVRFGTQRYSGIALRDFPRNWQGYSALELKVFSQEDSEFMVYLRVHDLQHNNDYTDRYNTSFKIRPGWNDLTVPLVDVERAPRNRSMDMTRVAGLVLFVGKLTVPRTVYIDDVSLISSGK